MSAALIKHVSAALIKHVSWLQALAVAAGGNRSISRSRSLRRIRSPLRASSNLSRVSTGHFAQQVLPHGILQGGNVPHGIQRRDVCTETTRRRLSPPTLKCISVWVQAGEGPQWLDSMGQALKDFLDDLRSGAACAPAPCDAHSSLTLR